MDSDSLSREQALLASLERVRRVSRQPSQPAARQSRGLWQWKFDALELIHEIVGTADRIGAACNWQGERVFRTEAQWTLLRALERWGCCPSMSDIARRFRISRQAARELVVRAERDGLVELFKCPADRRIVQVALRPVGRSWLNQARGGESEWINILLNGLDARDMRSITHVLRVIRHRLLRYEREQGK